MIPKELRAECLYVEFQVIGRGEIVISHVVLPQPEHPRRDATLLP